MFYRMITQNYVRRKCVKKIKEEIKQRNLTGYQAGGLTTQRIIKVTLKYSNLVEYAK